MMEIIDSQSLLNRFSIASSVYEAYIRLTPQTEEYTIFPFPYLIYGAYPLKQKWERLHYKMKSGYFPKETNFDSLLKEYAKGFEHGYSNFENDILSSTISIIINSDNTINKIYDFISNFRAAHFPITLNEKKEIIPANYYKSGIEDGYFYKGWCIILENSKLFAPHFQPNTPHLLDQRELALYLYYKKEIVTRKKTRSGDIAKQYEELLLPKSRGGSRFDGYYGDYRDFSSKRRPTDIKEVEAQILRLEKILYNIPDKFKLTGDSFQEAENDYLELKKYKP